MVSLQLARPVLTWCALVAAFVAAPAIGAVPALAQDAATPAGSAIDATPAKRRPAFSLTMGGSNAGLGAGLALAIPHGPRDILVRLAGTTEFTLFKTVSDDNVEFAVLYGLRTVESRLWLRGAAGLGVVRTTRPGESLGCEGFFFAVCDYEEVNNTTLGVAIHLDVGVSLTRSFGLGLMVMGNVNGDRSFGILGVELALGGLR